MKIFIDFDDVLFNTKDFSAYLKKFYTLHEINQELIKKHYYDPADESLVRLFNPYGLFERLEELEKIDLKNLREDFEKQLQDLKRFVFPDVKTFLEKIGKENVHIVSFGLLSFQQRKFLGGGLQGLVADFNVTKNLKAEVIAKILTEKKIHPKEKFVFIDDRIEHIESIKKVFPQVLTIFLSRKEGRYCDEKNEFCDWQVHDLKEAEKIISKL
jgi:FMN phosphatase YigB (HAD superfamily)